MTTPGNDLVTVRLVADRDAIQPDRPLPLRLSVTNRGRTALTKATAELTMEAEKGVLLTWDIELSDLAPGATCDDALRTVSPPWHLPLNVPPGPARLRLVLRDGVGAWLAEDQLELAVAERTTGAN